MRSGLVCFAAAALAWGGTPASFTEWNNQAVKLFAQGLYAEAEPLYRKALAAALDAGAAAVRERAVTESNLGALLRLTGRFAEAGSLLNGSLQAMAGIAGMEAVSVERTLSNLVALNRATGDLEQAARFAERADRLCAASPEIPKRERQGNRAVLAAIYVEQRRYDEADAILRELGRTVEGAMGVSVYNSLAALAIPRGNYADAQAFATEALERAQAHLREGHPARAAALNNLAQAHRFQGHYAEAEEQFWKAMAEWERGVGPRHPDLARGLMNFASFYHERGRESGAEELYRRAAAIFERALGAENPQTQASRSELANVLRAERRYGEASRLANSAVIALEQCVPKSDPRLLRAREICARLSEESARGRTEAARLLP
jgi:tetratricopeptide (TPR) repeat protein